jgi:hypothetical protein
MMSPSGREPQSTPAAPPTAPSPGYETRDTNVAAVVAVGVSLLALVMGALFLIYFLVISLTAPDGETSAPGDVRAPAMFADVLPSNQELLRKQQERVERKELSTYGWVDRETKIVRIPIQRAIEIVSEQGSLPNFAAQERNNDEHP